jgi:hypothetical protein
MFIPIIRAASADSAPDRLIGELWPSVLNLCRCDQRLAQASGLAVMVGDQLLRRAVGATGELGWTPVPRAVVSDGGFDRSRHEVGAAFQSLVGWRAVQEPALRLWRPDVHPSHYQEIRWDHRPRNRALACQACRESLALLLTGRVL